MKHFKTLFLFSIVALNSCTIFQSQNNETITEEKEVSNDQPTTQKTTHNYDEIADRMILWDDVFKIVREKYFVYFFSKTCSHCRNIKDFMIEKILNNDNIFAVESSKDVVFVSDTSTTLGDIDKINFGILGYPTLIYVENYYLKNNEAGEKNIKNLLVLNNI